MKLIYIQSDQSPATSMNGLGCSFGSIVGIILEIDSSAALVMQHSRASTLVRGQRLGGGGGGGGPAACTKLMAKRQEGSDGQSLPNAWLLSHTWLIQRRLIFRIRPPLNKKLQLKGVGN